MLLVPPDAGLPSWRVVGSVDLVADGGEVLADRAEFGAAVVGVCREPGGLRLVLVAAGAGVLHWLSNPSWANLAFSPEVGSRCQ